MRINFQTLSMKRNYHSGMWHIVKWVDSDNSNRWVDLALCNKGRVRSACYPDESFPNRYYRDAVDESLFSNTCQKCKDRYESRMVRQFRRELNKMGIVGK